MYVICILIQDEFFIARHIIHVHFYSCSLKPEIGVIKVVCSKSQNKVYILKGRVFKWL